MNSIEKSSISALLADAAYRSVNSENSQTDLVRVFSERMTPAQASLIAANFKVRASVETPNTINPLLWTAVWQRRLTCPLVRVVDSHGRRVSGQSQAGCTRVVVCSDA